MELLEGHFDIALETPDGIKKLRKLILSLAMQGKLVPQDSNDQPASELLKKIDVEQRRLIAEGKIKKKEPLPPIKAEKIPYKVPKGWVWTRLGTISEYIQRGRGPIYSEIRQIPIVSQKCIQWSGFNKHVVKFIEPSSINKYQCERFIRVGDLLWNSTGTGTIGRINVYQDELGEFDKVVADSHVTIVRLIGVHIEYVLNFLKSPSVQDDLEENASGTTNQIELNTTMVKNQLVPLPPLAEQKRIVAKIDQLMALCDKLEIERNERNQKRLTIHKAAMNRLLSAPDKTTFNTSWGFIINNFGELYSVPQNVDELKKNILQLAVMGKLVSQDSNDQPAGELLKEITAEKKKLIATKQLKIGQLTKDTKKINDQIVIPENWKWAKGEDIFFITKLAGFEYTKHIKLKDSGEVPVIRAQNVRSMRLDIENLKYIDLKTSESLARCALTKKALLVTFIGAGIGDVALFDKNERWHLAPNVAKMELFDNCDRFMDLKFINYYLMSIHGRKEIFKHLKSTAQPSISMGTIRDIDYPIPPIAEQKRLVRKIDQLMERCNNLEQQIKESTDKQSAILNAVLAKV